MVIDLVDKLIDRLIQLVRYKQELSRNLFTNFVEPIYLQFEAIHQQYLTSFKTYRDLLKETNTSIESVVDKIKEDKLFNEGQRQKIYALSRSSDDQLIDSFIFHIHEYLINPYDFANDYDGHKNRSGLSQRWRGTLIQELERYKIHIKSKEQIKEEVERMEAGEQKRRLFSLCRDEEYVNVLPVKFNEYIGNARDYEGLKEKIKPLASDYVKRLLIEVEYQFRPNPEPKKKAAIEVLDVMVEQMQDIYGEVSTKYVQLRKELLTKYE